MNRDEYKPETKGRQGSEKGIQKHNILDRCDRMDCCLSTARNYHGSECAID